MTEQKLFETALKESEEHYKMLSDLTIEGVIIHNKGILLDVNEALINMIGYKREELIGNNIIKLAVAPEYIALVKERIDQKSTLPYNIEAFRKNGERFWAEIESRNFEKDGQVLRVTAIRDISRHKKTEKLLLARNEMLKSIEQGVSSKLGIDFFETVVKELSKLFRANQVFIGEYDQKKHTVYTLCNYKNGERQADFKYVLDDTPCQNVVGKEICCYPENVASLFPRDEALKRDKIKAYLGAPLFDSHKKPIGILVALFQEKIEDVELVKSIIQIFSSRAGVEIEREKMMEELSESQRRFETLLSTLNGVFWIRNINTNTIEYISPQYEQIWQRSADELYANPDAFMEGVHHDDIKKVREGVKKIFDGQQFDLEYRIIQKNGDVRYIRAKSKLIENKKEKVIREYGYGEDVTSFREAAMEINKLAQVARSTTNGVIILNEEGHIEWVNEAVLSFTGYTFGEMKGKLPNELMYQHVELKDGLHRINDSFFQRKNAVNEIKVRKKNGQSRWVKLSVQKFYEPITQKTKYLVTEVDITKIKKSEKAIQRQNEQLKKTNQELDNFVYRVSHDLKAPISSVKGLVNISRLENSSKPVEECLDLIDGSLIKLDTFIAEILDYSRNARMKIEYHDIELKRFVSNILSDLQYIKGSESIKKIIDVPEDFKFRSDSKRLTFVFNNLFSNAIRFADHDKNAPYLKISAAQKNGKVEITCADNGIGIDEEHQKHVFDMFYRATENQPGSGLGLYIVKESIDKLNGSIEMESEAGEGTQFILSIPDKS